MVQADDEVMRGKPFYANINCDLSWVYVPESTDKQMFYLACEQCKKKVMPDGDSYSCEACSRSYSNAVPTYNFSVRISDCSGSLSLSVFGEQGQGLLGISAKEFFAMHEDIAAVKELAMNRLNQVPMCLVVRAKVDQGGYSENGPSIRYTLVRMGEHSYKSANQSLLQQLTAYSAQTMDEGFAF